MSEQLPILCILSEATWVRADWTHMRSDLKAERKLTACFTNVYQYDASGQRKPITDWEAAKRECLINIGNHFSFNFLVEVIKKIVGNRKGFLVYSGSTTEYSSAEPLVITPTFKACRDPIYAVTFAASCAEEFPLLQGFPPGDTPIDHFYLGWFPEKDSDIIDVILERWQRWPSPDFSPFLPNGPSPSLYSVEITFFGEENTMLGLYVGETFENRVCVKWLREVFGTEVLLKRLIRGELWRWAFAGSYEDLEEVQSIEE